MIKTKELSFIILVAVYTTSCMNQPIAINIDVPDQVLNLFEKRIFLKITPGFANFTYRYPHQQSLLIDIGTAQSFLFKKITKKLFAHVQTEGLSQNYTPDIIITPKLKNIELSKPSESGLTSYECRLEYLVLIKTREHAISHNILAYSRTPKLNKNENQVISELMSQCIRKIASKLEIKLLELANEV